MESLSKLIYEGVDRGVGLSPSRPYPPPPSRPIVSLLPSWSSARFALPNFSSSSFSPFFAQFFSPLPPPAPSSPPPSPSSPYYHASTPPSRPLISHLPLTLSAPHICCAHTEQNSYSHASSIDFSQRYCL